MLMGEFVKLSNNLVKVSYLKKAKRICLDNYSAEIRVFRKKRIGYLHFKDIETSKKAFNFIEKLLKGEVKKATPVVEEPVKEISKTNIRKILDIIEKLKFEIENNEEIWQGSYTVNKMVLISTWFKDVNPLIALDTNLIVIDFDIKSTLIRFYFRLNNTLASNLEKLEEKLNLLL